MKIQKLVCSTILASMALGAVAPTTHAEGANVINSKGEIQYIENTDGVTPIDPEKPKEEITIDPEEGENNENKAGALRLDVVSHLKFGQQKLTTKAASYFASPTTIKREGLDENGEVTVQERKRGNYVQLTDQRAGDLPKGWKLSAQVTQPFQNDKGDVLKGATITYSNPFVNSVQESSNYPTPTSQVTLDTYTTPSDAPASQTFAKADAEKGWGTYTIEYGRPSLDSNGNVVEDGSGEIKPTMDKSVSLNVPVNALSTQSSYKAVITWTVSELPGV